MKILTKISLYLMNIFCLVIVVSFLIHFQQIQWLWYGFFICLILSLCFFVFIKNKKMEGDGVFFIWVGLYLLCSYTYLYNGLNPQEEFLVPVAFFLVGADILMDQ